MRKNNLRSYAELFFKFLLVSPLVWVFFMLETDKNIGKSILGALTIQAIGSLLGIALFNYLQHGQLTWFVNYYTSIEYKYQKSMDDREEKYRSPKS